MAEREYKDAFTLDGRLKPPMGVTRTKLKETQRLLEGALAGDIMCDAKFRETVTTSDAMFNAAYLTSLALIPQLDRADSIVSQIAGTRVVPDFRPVVLYSLFGDLDGAGITANGGAATVPEATPYPYVSVTGQESMYSSMAKHGLKFSYTWEARVNDTVGFFSELPQELAYVALKTEENAVLDALINGTGAASNLDGGTLPDGTVVPPNAPLTPSAIWQAIIEESNRTINGRKIGRASGYNVLVPVGVKDFIDWKLNQTIVSIQDGSVTLSPGDQSMLNGVTVVESDRLTGAEWYLIPKPGSTRRPVLELLRLRGYETPELRVENATGTYVGGGAISPFEGDFSTDSVSLRLRMAVGGANWSPDSYVVKSNGSGA